MSLEVRDRLARLPHMGKSELLALWDELFRRPPPPRLRRGLLIKFLAYRLQEQAYGGLSAAVRKRLRELARKFEADPNAEISGAPRIKLGTRLIRDWGGTTYRVTVLANGYEYAGQRYSSLSEIARLITGTRWSGPLFFGLKDNPGKERSDGQRS